MTFEDKLKAMLVERGLFDDQADEILALVKADEANKAMRGRWQDNIEEYPPQMIVVLWISVKDAALKWIDEHCPQASFRPFRPLFEDDQTVTEPVP